MWEEHQPQGKAAVMWEAHQQGCTVPEAQALTPEGWKNLYELEAHPDLPIATLNPDSGAFEWQPFSLNIFDFDGELTHYEGQRVDHVLTDAHDVWVRQTKDYTVRGGRRWDHGSKWRKRKAGETSGPTWSLRGGADAFRGQLTLPVIPKSRLKPEYRFPTPEAMVKFIGWWVSEGSVSRGEIRIGQSLYVHPENFSEIHDLLGELGIGNKKTNCRDKNGRTHAVSVSNVGVGRWLTTQFGHTDKERRLPAWVKDLPRPLLGLLLETLRKGDGDSEQKNPRAWRYSTISERLADDVQEIAMKLGYLTAVRVEERSGPQQAIWRVYMDPRGLMSLPKRKTKAYSGEVWCPTVANGLWFMRLNGRAVVTGNSISGDCFIKIAFEDEYADPAGNMHPARIRILPLNSAFCLDEDTEILTVDGWKDYASVVVGDLALCLDPETDEIRWEPVERVNVFDWDGPVTCWSNDRFEAVSTDDHRWLVENRRSKEHQIRTTGDLNTLGGSLRLVTGGGTSLCFSEVAKWSDEMVELVGWFVTEGHIGPNGRQVWLTQDAEVNPAHAASIRRLQHHFQQFGDVVEYDYGVRANQWRFGNEVSKTVLEAAPDKQITPAFLCSLTHAQARLFYETLQAGDGGEHNAPPGTVNTKIWYQASTLRIAGFQMLCGMLGLRTQAKYRDRLQPGHPYRPGNDCEGEVTVYSSRYTGLKELKKERTHKQGIMWCPTTPTGTWFARKKGVMPKGRSGRQVCYWTGNCFP